ncbi:MAG TPA: hypothetical protein VMW17_12945 [Candidatus Binatia bacterium]|nr:hypothetical protein [Candidatus Binatia bacterium]
MSDDGIVFRVAADRDPGGLVLGDIVDAHLAYERARAARSFWVNLFALLGIAAGISTLIPEIFGVHVQQSVGAMWAASGVVAIGRVIAERKWARRRSQLLAQNAIIEDSRES